MKKLAYGFMGLAVSAFVILLIAQTSNPAKYGSMYSSDGSGNPGTWVAVTGTGTPYTGGSVTPAGLMVSTDGSGKPGTWVAATANTFGGNFSNWVGSNPAVSCLSGSGTLSDQMYTLTVGRVIFLNITVTMSAVGTCNGIFQVSLPFTTPGAPQTMACQEMINTGIVGKGFVGSSSNILQIAKYDNSGYAGAGSQVVCNGVLMGP